MVHTLSSLRPALTALTLAGGLMFAAEASAALIGIDFGGSAPTNWNSGPAGPNPQGVTNMIDESGAATAVDISYPGPFGLATTLVSAAVDPAQIPSHANSLANLGNGALFEGTEINFIYSDLAPLTTYTIWLFYVNSLGSTAPHTTITGDGFQAFFVPTLPIGAGDDMGINAHPGSNAQLETFGLDVVSSATGTLQMLLASGGVGTIVAGIAIEQAQIAEPTVFGLLGAGLAALGWSRRRKA